MGEDFWVVAYDGRIRGTRLEKLTQPASYIVYREGDVYKAKSGRTGRVEFEDTDAGRVIQSCIDSLPAGGRVYVKTGKYYAYTPITLRPTITVEGEMSSHYEQRGTVIFKCFDGGFLFDTDPSVSNWCITLRGIYMQPLENRTGGGVRLRAAWFSRIEKCFIYYFQSDGAVIETVPGKPNWNNEINGCYFFMVKERAIVIDATDNRVRNTYVDCVYGNPGSYAVVINRDDTEVRGCHIMAGGVTHNTLVSGILITSNSNFNRIVSNFIDNLDRGIVVEGSGNVIMGNFFYLSRKELLVLKGHRNTVTGNTFYLSSKEASGYPDILISGGRRNVILGNTFTFGSTNSHPAVKEEGDADYNLLAHNTIDPDYPAPAVTTVGANTVIKGNVGFRTENSGTATIPAGSTYVDVTHGLSITPRPERIRVVPLDNLGGRSFWVSNVTSTGFRINISSADTVDHSFGWSYE
ncbi:MAG: NosD domain-containing protein [Thermofilaceae archaeon]